MIDEFLIKIFLQKCDTFYYMKLLEFFHTYSSQNVSFLDSLFKKHRDKKDMFYLSSIYDSSKTEHKDSPDSYFEFKAQNIYKHIPSHYKKNTRLGKKRIKILDYGCGNCKMAQYFSKLCNQKEYWGVDIELWDGKKYTHSRSKTSTLNFKIIQENKRVPFDNETFDIVIVSMVMHHIDNLDFVLEEIYRILKKGGMLIVREHDAITILDKLLVEIQHAVYMFHEFNDKYVSQKNYFSKYFSLKEIAEQLSKKNILLIHRVFDKKHNFVKLQRQYNAYFVKT